jgi:hypothetical protein
MARTPTMNGAFRGNACRFAGLYPIACCPVAVFFRLGGKALDLVRPLVYRELLRFLQVAGQNRAR